MIFRPTFNSLGKHKRLQRIFHDGRCVIIPLDDSLISGAKLGLLDLQDKVSEINSGCPNAVLGYYGSFSLLDNINSMLPIILNLTASTECFNHTKKNLITTVDKALSLGADAVAVHINISSQFESDMLKTLGDVSSRCDDFGVPLMVLAYPRSEKIIDGHSVDENYISLLEENPQEYVALVSHSVRVAFELGADIIKTQYTGSKESFSDVIKAAQGVPIVIAGGEQKDDVSFFSMCRDAIDVGASGICIGRNVFNRHHSQNVIMILRRIVFENISAEESVNMLYDLSKGDLYNEKL